MRLRVVGALVALAAAAAAGSAAARQGGLPPLPKVSPITADFRQVDFATYYSVDATPAPGKTLTYRWKLRPPLLDPGCARFAASATHPDQAVWHHGDADGCAHGKLGPNGHKGRITLTVSDDAYRCVVKYYGTNSGTGSAARCQSFAKTRALTALDAAVSAEHRLLGGPRSDDAKEFDQAAAQIDRTVEALSDLDAPAAKEAAKRLARAKVLAKLARQIPSKRESQLRQALELEQSARELIERLP